MNMCQSGGGASPGSSGGRWTVGPQLNEGWNQQTGPGGRGRKGGVVKGFGRKKGRI